MRRASAADVTIVDGDLSRVDHQRAIVAMLDAFTLDQDGEPLSAQAKRDMIPGLRAHPACYIFLAYRDDAPIGFSICFLGFSTFMARPLLNIHDIFVDSSARGLGIGAMLLERIEAKARDLNCARITLEVKQDNHIARALYRKTGYDQVVVGPNRIPMEFWHKPL